MSITGGEVSNNTAIGGGGIFIGRDCVLTMTGGFIKGNNAETDQSVTHGDGVYVGGTFNVGDGVDGGPVVDENNDVYLPTGHVIDVISTFTGAIPDNPINITSEERDVEPETGTPQEPSLSIITTKPAQSVRRRRRMMTSYMCQALRCWHKIHCSASARA